MTRPSGPVVPTAAEPPIAIVTVRPAIAAPPAVSVSAAVTVGLSPNVPLAGRRDERQRRRGLRRAGEPVVRPAVVVERDEAEAVGRLDDVLQVGRRDSEPPLPESRVLLVPQPQAAAPRIARGRAVPRVRRRLAYR